MGICHAGWRGALKGIVQKTVHLLKQKGATEIQAVIGPTIRWQHYSVGQEMQEICVTQDPSSQTFFIHHAGELFFDLPGYIQKGLKDEHVQVWDSQQDTFGDIYYSRRWTLKYSPDALPSGFCSAVVCPPRT